MKAELLTKLLAKSPSFEMSSGRNHNAITPEDINHMLGIKKLNRKEYNFLLMKYLDNDDSKSSLFDDLYEDTYQLFYKTELPKEKGLIRKFLNSAIVEVVTERCFFCNGTGVIKTLASINKCNHCDNGIFLYDDKVRCEMTGFPHNVFMKYKETYLEIIDMINRLENSARSKIGDY